MLLLWVDQAHGVTFLHNMSFLGRTRRSLRGQSHQKLSVTAFWLSAYGLFCSFASSADACRSAAQIPEVLIVIMVLVDRLVPHAGACLQSDSTDFICFGERPACLEVIFGPTLAYWVLTMTESQTAN